jgi:hypothetical protein
MSLCTKYVIHRNVNACLSECLTLNGQQTLVLLEPTACISHLSLTEVKDVLWPTYDPTASDRK